MFVPGNGIDAAIDNFVNNFYGPDSALYRAGILRGSDEGLVDNLEALADVLTTSARDLSGTDASDYAGSIESLIAMGSYETYPARYAYLRSAMDARVAEDLVSLARSASDRFEVLVALAKRSGLSNRTARFLRRVSRCFLYGFDVECGVMCRSALDAEFEAEISTDDCVQADRYQRRRDGEALCNLYDRIETAGKIGRLSPDIIDLAHRIRTDTNQLVHRDPRPPSNLTQLIEHTIEVISALHRDDARH